MNENSKARMFDWALHNAPVADSLDRLVLIMCADHADRDGRNAHPSLDTLAGRALTDRASIHRSLERLVNGGMLRVQESSPKGSPVYEVLVPADKA